MIRESVFRDLLSNHQVLWNDVPYFLEDWLVKYETEGIAYTSAYSIKDLYTLYQSFPQQFKFTQIYKSKRYHK